MTMRYVPGASPVAVTPRGFAVLEQSAAPDVAARMHELIASGRGLGGVLDALTAVYGTTLTALPAFAVALVDGDAIRVAVRGGMALEIDGGAARVSGEGVTTWSERTVAAGSQIAFGEMTDAAALPLSDGVVLAAAGSWTPAAVAAEPFAVALEPARGEDDPVVSSPEPAPVVDQPGPVDQSATVVDQPVPVVDQSVPVVDQSATVVDQSATGFDPDAPLDYTVPSVRRTARTASVAQTGGDLAGIELPDESTLMPDDEEIDLGGEAGWEKTVIRDGSPSDSELLPDDSTVISPRGDHDGETISLAQARALRAARESAVIDSMPPLAPPRRPAPGQVRLSTGQVVRLDRTVVVGRRPRSTRVSGTDLPHLVAVESPQQDISRSHLELRVEGDGIVATDLRTTNGTTLHRPGSDPVRLHPGEGTVVVAGDVLDLGDGITVAIEEQS